MEISQYAPVMIPTLNRFEHFKRCVTSLSKCTHAEKTDLVIALDYPLKEEHWDGYRKIKEFLKTLNGFKSIEIIERDKNFGAVDNIKQAREYIFSKYDRLIFSEDDNEFSPNFLDYINKGLDKFEDDPRVLAVCGYNYPIDFPVSYRHSIYYSKAFSAWGYGIWKKKYKEIDYNIDNIKKFLHNPLNIPELINIPYGVLFGLIHIVKTGTITGDRIFVYNNCKNNTYCVFPTISLVRNHGHDGSGVHCNKMQENPFVIQKIDENSLFKYNDVIIDNMNGIKKAYSLYVKEYSSLTIIKYLKILFKYLLFLVGGEK